MTLDEKLKNILLSYYTEDSQSREAAVEQIKRAFVDEGYAPIKLITLLRDEEMIKMLQIAGIETGKAMDMYANELWVRNRGLEEKLDD